MIRDILVVSNGGATITQIMFKAYMSHGQVKGYVGELLESGFLEFDSTERKYRTAPKGLEYLQAVERISEMLAISTKRSASSKRVEEAFQF